MTELILGVLTLLASGSAGLLEAWRRATMARLTMAEASNGRAAAEHGETRAALDRARSELRSERDTIRALQLECAHMTRDRDRLVSDRAAAVRLSQQALDQRDAARAEGNRWVAEAGSLKAQLETAAHCAGEHRRRADAAEAEAASLRGSVEEALGLGQEAEARAASWREKAEKEARQHLETVATCEAFAKEAGRLMAEASERINQQAAALAEREKELAALKQVADSLGDELSEWLAGDVEAAAKLADLEERNATQAREIDRLRIEAQVLAAERDRLGRMAGAALGGPAPEKAYQVGGVDLAAYLSSVRGR